MRRLLDNLPFDGARAWPARWITHAAPAEARSFAAAFRLGFSLEVDADVTLHVSGDQRYELFLDGRRIGRGPERGDLWNWHFETHQLLLETGEHTLLARLWWLDLADRTAPLAQIGLAPAFVLAADAPYTELLTTGIAPWQAKTLGGLAFDEARMYGEGPETTLDAARFDWGFERGLGEGWTPAERSGPARTAPDKWGPTNSRCLGPAVLPEMIDLPCASGKVRHLDEPASAETESLRVDSESHLRLEDGTWQAMVEGRKGVTIPPRSRRRAIIDLDQYVCAYAELTASGGAGATVRLRWAESLFAEPSRSDGIKGNRDLIEGKVFVGRGDTLLCDGGEGRVLHGPWWACGRYLELYVETRDVAVTLDSLRLRETHYPLELESRFTCSEPRYDDIFDVGFRALQMCAHETYMDCPYYEQLMYAGDTRIEALVTYVSAEDARLPRKAIELFDASRLPNGLTRSRYPDRAGQTIPQFALFWVAMVHDYALWRGDPEFVADRMPGVRSVLETFLAHLDADSLLHLPRGWDFVDWVPGWELGRPPHPEGSPCGFDNWLLVMVLHLAEQVERWLGEELLADRLAVKRDAIATAATEAFLDDRRGLMATSPGGEHFCEHTQCMALLSGRLDADTARRVGRGLCEAPDLDRATYYFQHYLFEAYRMLGRTDLLLEHLEEWFELPSRGLRTTPEKPEPSRSDCHAWSAHPIYHAIASILGVRPAAMGFAEVSIRPQLGPLRRAVGEVVTPSGMVAVDLRRHADRLDAYIQLPRGVTGSLVVLDEYHRLRSGSQQLSIECEGDEP